MPPKYIIFDMEWNQPASQEEKVPELSHGEIVQFGYFVLDERLEQIYKEDITVKPVCYPKMNPYVSALTGITQKRAERGIPFSEAIASMAKHFSPETVLFTWGDDDMPILRENMRYHGVEAPLPAHYNLQRFFCVQTNTPQKQIGLKTAAEFFGIDVNVQYHDALNDAYLTLLIAKRLDIPRGISEYNSVMPVRAKKQGAQQPWLAEAPAVSERYEYTRGIDGLAEFCRSKGAVCPDCGKNTDTETYCRQGKTAYVTKACCDEHGLFFVRYSMGAQSVQADIYRLTEPLEKFYRSKLRQKEKNDSCRRLYRDAHRIKSRKKDIK